MKAKITAKRIDKYRGRISEQRMRIKLGMFWRRIAVESAGSSLRDAEIHFSLPCQLPVICDFFKTP